MNYLPLKLAKLRKHYNYSQAYLAEVLDVDVLDYMAYENGGKMINYEKAKKLASLYKVNIVEILKNSEEVTLYDVASSKTDEINIEYFLPKKTLGQRIKKHPIFLGIGIGICIAVIAFVVIKNSNSPYVSLVDNTDRLSCSNTSLIYIDDLKAVKGAGDNASGQISNLPSNGAIKVSEGDDFSIVLMDDGTLLGFGLIDAYQKELKKLNGIVDIAAGSKHFLALDRKGKTYCIGDNSKGQCSLTNFNNIKSIYAAENASIGIDNNNNAVYAGTFIGTSMIRNTSNIIDLDTSANNLIILKADGTCDYVAGKDNSIYLEILKWNNIEKVVCGEDYFAGLRSDKTIELVSLSLDKNATKNWKNIIAIDGGDDYLVAFDGKDIYGLGQNNYHQFPGDTTTKTLPTTKNILIDYDNHEVRITFDKVNNASQYQVAIILAEGNEVTKIVNGNSASFDTSILKDNELYQVSVMAIGQSPYVNSRKALSSFVFLKSVEE